jgi:hypothetical protein
MEGLLSPINGNNETKQSIFTADGYQSLAHQNLNLQQIQSTLTRDI